MSSPQIASLSSERRSHRRVSAKLKAMLILGDALEACLLLDRSESGLRLLLLQPRDLPVAFEIGDKLGGARRSVRLVWVAGREAGVAFTDDAPGL